MSKSMMVFLLSLVVLAAAVTTLTGCGEKAQEVVATKDVQAPAEISELQTALQAMTQSGTYSSVDSLQAAWNNVQSAYDDVLAWAQNSKDVATDKVTNLKNAFEQLKAAVTNFGSDQPMEQKVDTLQAAVQAMKDALDQF